MAFVSGFAALSAFSDNVMCAFRGGRGWGVGGPESLKS